MEHQSKQPPITLEKAKAQFLRHHFGKPGETTEMYLEMYRNGEFDFYYNMSDNERRIEAIRKRFYRKTSGGYEYFCMGDLPKHWRESVVDFMERNNVSHRDVTEEGEYKNRCYPIHLIRDWLIATDFARDL